MATWAGIRSHAAMQDHSGQELDDVLGRYAARGPRGARRVVVLTGAGISAESGVPTFRGPGGYWTSDDGRKHRAIDLARASTFARVPGLVWRFYLERLRHVRGVEPNVAHAALVTLEDALGDRFTLVTQNVDGLHRRAGSGPRRTFAIHGDLASVRCGADCGREVVSLPASALELAEAELPVRPSEPPAALACPRCGAWMRPHVLWFDECYDEGWFRFDSTCAAIRAADLLVVVGTSGATSLPNLVVDDADSRRVPFLVIDTDPGAFSERADRSHHAAFLRGPATRLVPVVVEALLALEGGVR